MKFILLNLGALLRAISNLIPSWGKDSTALEVGQVAPEFTLPDSNGRPLSLSDFHGKRVLLLFYPGDATPICSHQLCELQNRRDELPDVVVLGINPAPGRLHRRFQARFGLEMPLLVDDGLKVAGLYGARVGGLVVRTLVWIDEEGRVSQVRRGAPSFKVLIEDAGL